MKRILLIDDETSLREEIEEWLTLEDYQVDCASNGLEGIQLAFRNTHDLVICDITMPQLDGYGVLLELRSNPSTATIPFIFMTARASHDDIRQGMSLGADDYITKPFTSFELLQSVESRLKKKEMQNKLNQDAIEKWKQAFENEREKRLLKAKLVAMFSHDFRNPLTTIASGISMVRDYSDRMEPERQQKHLDRALSSIRQLTQMLDDMLVTSQMESGHMRCELELLDVTQFLQEIVDDFQTIHHETHALVFKSNINTSIHVDSRLLRQIASNLISNAIKYSPSGGQIHVNLLAEKQELILAVRDKGIGISETEQVDLFSAFRRASNIGDVAGTGLGLAIVKQAVDLHGGSIELESQEGIGTNITVKLPIKSS